VVEPFHQRSMVALAAPVAHSMVAGDGIQHAGAQPGAGRAVKAALAVKGAHGDFPGDAESVPLPRRRVPR
jgi:hypothetical protein